MENKYFNNLKKTWHSFTGQGEKEQLSGSDQEKIVVFIICLVLAFSLWMIVNLNRDFNIDIKLPVELGNITQNMALVNHLPQQVTASVSGKGWNLINTYNNPPHVYIDVSGKEVNLFEQVRRQISSASHVTVQKVDPLYLQVKLEKKESKKIPVKPNIKLNLASDYDFLKEPLLTPDSITIRGAASHIANITQWPTDSLSISDVKNSFSKQLSLKQPSSLVTLSASSVNYQVEVAQFTEGEATVPVESRDFPAGDVVTFSPSTVHIKYRVPLSEYTDFSRKHPFTAYITYAQIQNDTTGFVTPEIESLQAKTPVKVKMVQPKEVAYFTIIGQ